MLNHELFPLFCLVLLIFRRLSRGFLPQEKETIRSPPFPGTHQNAPPRHTNSRLKSKLIKPECTNPSPLLFAHG